MKNANTKLLDCITCDPVGESTTLRIPDKPSRFLVDSTVPYVQCGVCIVQGREVPRHLKAVHVPETELDQLELGEVAA